MHRTGYPDAAGSGGHGPRLLHHVILPTKAISLVIGFPPGGGADTVGRVIAKHLSAELGVPVNIANTEGGNQIPAALAVFSASPDGYTLLQDSPATSSLHGTMPDLPYKLEERTWGPMLASTPYAYYVGGKSPWNSLKDVVDAAKKDPASFSWANLGGKSGTDIAVMAFLDVAGIDIRKTKAVPFNGSGPALTGVAGGHVMFGGAAASAVFPLRASGDIKVLGVSGDKRVSSLADVPSSKEAGFEAAWTGWYSLSGPKNLPKAIVERLDSAAKKLTESAAFVKDLEAIANTPVYKAPDLIWPQVQKEIDILKTIESKFSGTSK